VGESVHVAARQGDFGGGNTVHREFSFSGRLTEIIFAIRRINYERQDNTTVGVVKIS